MKIDAFIIIKRSNGNLNLVYPKVIRCGNVIIASKIKQIIETSLCLISKNIFFLKKSINSKIRFINNKGVYEIKCIIILYFVGDGLYKGDQNLINLIYTNFNSSVG